MSCCTANETQALLCLQCIHGLRPLPGFQKIGDGNFPHQRYMRSISDHLDRHPFGRYAVESWDFHLREAGIPSLSTIKTVHEFLAQRENRDTLMLLTFIVKKQSSWNVPIGESLFHIAAYFNLHWIVRSLISADSTALHRKTGMKAIPLIFASEMGGTESVRALLDAGADPNAFERDG